jgi:flagellar biosynthesis/type III secretory pathway M-ring protein FliF/YscJ
MTSVGPAASGSKTALLGGGVGGGSFGIGTITTMFDSGLIKTVSLGALAVVALALMLNMVRKAGKSRELPSAEELVGIPPALQPGSDVVGEADEGDTAMLGIEIDDDSLKTTKMLDEIGTLVKNNPDTAASVFSRWLSEEE